VRVGLDEAGRGPVLGPLVIAACGIPEQDVPLLVQAGVRDSKRLSAKRRDELVNWFKQVGNERGWCSNLVVYSAANIDEALHADGLNWLEVRGFAKAIQDLGPTTGLSVLADACDVNAERFTQRIVNLLPGWPWVECTMVSEHKADDRDPVVAMASILAKTHRDQAMSDMAKRLERPLGSGYPSDPATVQALPSLITSESIDVDVRWEWATVKRYWARHHAGQPPTRGQPPTVQHTLFQSEDPSIS